MFSKIELLLAWKFFKPKKNSSSIMTIVSILGIGTGICVLLITMSVMTGLSDEIKNKIVNKIPHIEITSKHNSVIQNYEKIIQKIKKLNIQAEPRIYGEAIISRTSDQINKQKEIILRQIIGVKIGSVNNDIKMKLYDTKNGLIIDRKIMHKLKLNVYDALSIITIEQLKNFISMSINNAIPKINEITKNYHELQKNKIKIIGYLEDYPDDFQIPFIVTDLENASKIFKYEDNTCTKIVINVDDPFNVEKQYNLIKEKLNLNYYNVVHWKQIHKHKLQLLDLEKNLIFFILIFIILVSSYSIASALTLMVTQKTKEIGILKAMGVSSGGIMRIFIINGLITSIFGVLLGIVIGLLSISWRVEVLNIFLKIINIITNQNNQVLYLPVKILFSDIFIIIIFTISLCTISSIIPALKAAKLIPARALRYEK